MLSKRFNLWNSEAIRGFLKNANLSGKMKNNINYAYQDWCKSKDFDYSFTYFEEKDQSFPYIQERLR